MARYLLLFLLLVLPAVGNTRSRSIQLRMDSLKLSRVDWLHHVGDDRAFAKKDYNDTAWEKRQSILGFVDEKDTFVTQLGWFRLHVHVDTSLAGKVLALQVFQEGASEFYLDGKLIETFGELKGPDNSTYYDPTGIPVPFTFNDTGEHVFAVRYANYDAIERYKRFEHTQAGFAMAIVPAADAVFSRTQQVILHSTLTVFMIGIFLTLSLIHILLYFQMRKDKSNLFFSMFTFALAALIFLLNRLTLGHEPEIKLYYGFAIVPLICLVCCAQSGMLHYLFSKKRISFYLILAFSFLTTVIRFFDFSTAMVAILLLLLYTTIESLVIITIAIVKKREGAFIMGFGMGLMLVLIVYIGATIVVTDQFLINENSVAGQIFELLFAFAILCLPLSMSVLLSKRYAGVSKNLKQQLDQVSVLSEKTRTQELEKQRLLENRQEELEREVALRTTEVRQQHEALKTEKKKSDDLLLNILPAEVAEELKEHGASKARLYEDVSVLFTDFVNFTGVSEQLSPAELVAELDHCFREFDNIIHQFGLEKIKTIGDAYLAVSGMPASNKEHAKNTTLAAIAIRDFMEQRQGEKHNSFAIRLGIHSGPVVAGIVGVKKFAYDIWGDTVNTAARMEQHGEAGRINISETTCEVVRDDFECTPRGDHEVKNKGRMRMYFVEKRMD